MTEAEKMAKGYLWVDTEEYIKEQSIAKDLMYEFNHSRPSEVAKREEIMHRLFGYVGENVCIQQPITIARGRLVSIGANTYINSNFTLVDDYKITIGKDCLIAPNVVISTTGHPIEPSMRTKGMYSFPVTIGNNVWIGMGAMILPGVTIGDNSVIGAGSVVSRDIPANVIAMGAPCKVIREINDYDKEYYFRGYKF